MIKIKSAAKVAEEEALLAQAKIACAKQPRTTDTTDYETAKTDFRNCALQIRQYLNANLPQLVGMFPDLKTFRGSFEESKIVMLYLAQNDDWSLTKLMLMLQQLDTTMEYEASALCIEPPRTWWSCWEDELGPYDQRNAQEATQPQEEVVPTQSE